ncbi:MAG: DUF1800 domain-containing protein [Arcicella sp.]|nr:DUF1800 domain-containing protein [Arcicella sp.]
MNYSLNAYSQPLTTAQAAHLLRRTTFGPTQSHISAFTGVDAGLAIDTLINNINYNPTPPVDLNITMTATVGQPYIGTVYNSARNGDFMSYIRNWWIGLMAAQTNNPSLAEKMTMFWQNHFVTELPEVNEYRAVYQYFNLIRTSILGNFRDFVYNITKDPAMLKYLNGHDNEKNRANENYARELQELFVVGEKDFAGNNNYTENDVKAAARVLTGWRYANFYTANTSSVSTTFSLTRHDTTNKQFSTKYPDPVNPTLGTVITGRATNPVGTTAGDLELDDLLIMLFRHPETPKFICRKLYRFFVNPNVTQAVEDNVIIPLANLFKSQDPTTGRTFEIKPVIKKLLMSQHFYDEENMGSIVKAPTELVVGTLQFLGFPTPLITAGNLSSITTYKNYTDYIYARLNEMQMSILAQPTVFGYDAYYQPGLSRNWINTSMIGLRNSFGDRMITGQTFSSSGVTPINRAKIDFLTWVDKPTTPAPNYYDASDCTCIIDLLTKNLFATGLNANQKNFLIDTIFMQSEARDIWTTQWNLYKTATSANLASRTTTVRVRMENVMKFLFRMAEYQIF